MQEKKRGKTKIGVVKSDAMNKSVTVMVQRTVLDERFQKYVRRRNKFMAHDEKNACQKGDTVLIRECRPISKQKRWRVENVLKKSSGLE